MKKEELKSICEAHRNLRKAYMNLKEAGFSSNRKEIKLLQDEMNKLQDELSKHGEIVFQDSKTYFKPEDITVENSLEDLFVYRLTANPA